jgi:hypothetical protein
MTLTSTPRSELSACGSGARGEALMTASGQLSKDRKVCHIWTFGWREYS